MQRYEKISNLTSLFQNHFNFILTYKVTKIEKNAFKGRKKLKKVTLGANVDTIGDGAFENCSALESITIPKNIKKIGKKAFKGCKKLKKITIKSKLLKASSVGSGAFSGTNKEAVVKVPKGKKKAYLGFLYKKGLAKSATVK